MNTSEHPDNHWYKQPWIWFVIALLVATMLASFMMLFIATLNAPDLVIEDYANIDELTEKTRQQDRRAAELNLTATVYVDQAAVRVELNSDTMTVMPDTVIVRARNSTLAELDTQAELTRSGETYAGELSLPGNAYDLLIEDPLGDWRLSKRMFGRPAQTTLYPFIPGR